MNRRSLRSQPNRRSKRPNATGAFGWSLANTILSRVGTLGIGIVLARVLGPEQFGTFAVALVALMAVLSFNELGVSLAIVRWPGDPALIAPTVNTISLVSSALFCILAWAGAPLFTETMGNPEATGVVRLLVLSVLVNGAVATPAALLQRNFREKARMGIDQLNVWVGAITSVVLALFGWGAMALAVGRVLGSLVSGVLFIRFSPVPYRVGWDRTYVKPLLKFGLPLAGTSIILFMIGYADQLTAGAKLGAVGLGFYVLAFNLSNWPVSIVSQPLRRVAPAAFASIQSDPAKLQLIIVGLFGILAAATIPAFFALAGSARPLVRLVYGDDWLPAASALSWLVIAALSKIFCELIYDYMVVIGRTGTVFSIQAASLVVLVPALFMGATWGGLAGLAAAQALVSCAVVLPLYLWQMRRVGVSVSSCLGRLWLPLACGLAVGIAAWLFATYLENVFLALICGGISSIAVICGLLYMRRGDLKEIRRLGNTEQQEAWA